MRKADIIVGAILFVVSLVTIFVIIPHQVSKVPEGNISPALLPTVAMVIIGGLSLILLLKNLFGPAKASRDSFSFNAKNWRYIGIFSALLFLSLGAIYWLGFILGGIFLIAALMIFLGSRRPLVMALVSIGTTTVIYFALWKLLKIPLP